MTEDEQDDVIVEVGARQIDDLLRLVRPSKRDIVAERIGARVRSLRSGRISSLGIPVQHDPRREPIETRTDPDATPPRPYTSGELRAAKDPHDPRSGETKAGGIRVPPYKPTR